MSVETVTVQVKSVDMQVGRADARVGRKEFEKEASFDFMVMCQRMDPRIPACVARWRGNRSRNGRCSCKGVTYAC